MTDYTVASSEHASRHATSGADPLTPANIGAALAPWASSDALNAWGHSYVAGVWSGGYGWVGQTLSPTAAAGLGLGLRNNGFGGSEMTDAYRGWGAVLRHWTTSSTPATGMAENRFTAPVSVHFIMHGINDLGSYGSAGIVPFTGSLRAAVSRLRAAAVFEDTDASVTYSGTDWTQLAMAGLSSGGTSHYTSTSGATLTITTPADFPGGTLVLGVFAWTTGGATFTSQSINGTVYSVNTADVYESGQYVATVLRIPNVPAGSASYVFTVSNIGTGAYAGFDYWQWEPDASDGPVVALVRQPHLVDYTAYTSQTITNTMVDSLNTAIQSVSTEFGARVPYVDTSSIDGDATCFTAGNAHPTPKGHRIIGEAIVSAIEGVARFHHGPSVFSRRVEFLSAAPTDAYAATYQVGDIVYNNAPAVAGTAGSQYIVTGWICTVAGAPGTWVALRSLTGT